MPAAARLNDLEGTRRPRAQDIDRHVGARMRERRILLGLTQQQMAELIGVTYQQAHKYERGLNRISAGRLFEIAQVMGVPVAWFFEGLGGGDGISTIPASHVISSSLEVRWVITVLPVVTFASLSSAGSLP